MPHKHPSSSSLLPLRLCGLPFSATQSPRPLRSLRLCGVLLGRFSGHAAGRMNDNALNTHIFQIFSLRPLRLCGLLFSCARLTALLMAFAFCLVSAFAQTGANVLVIVNDANTDSRTIADYYATKRALPPENVCHVRTADSDAISRDRFEREILDPVAGHLRSHNLQDRILYIVTTLGIPLVVEGNAGAVGDMASVEIGRASCRERV